MHFDKYFEKQRITKHLQTVEKELRAKPINNPETKKQRDITLSYLNEYWTKGQYPKNTDFQIRTPYFKDKFGTLCAMAYIVQRSGHQEIVDEIHSTNNNVYINDVTEGSLIEWLKTSGITKEDAARIQPAYDGIHAAGGLFYGLLIFGLLELATYYLLRKWSLKGLNKFIAYISISFFNIFLTIFLTYYFILLVGGQIYY